MAKLRVRFGAEHIDEHIDEHIAEHIAEHIHKHIDLIRPQTSR